MYHGKTQASVQEFMVLILKTFMLHHGNIGMRLCVHLMLMEIPMKIVMIQWVVGVVELFQMIQQNMISSLYVSKSICLFVVKSLEHNYVWHLQAYEDKMNIMLQNISQANPEPMPKYLKKGNLFWHTLGVNGMLKKRIIWHIH